MRRLMILRLVALLLIATVPVAVSLVAVPAPVAVADDDDDQGENGNGEDKKDKKDNGNKNPGNNGNNGNQGNNGNNGNNKIVEPIEGYTVEVTCEYDAEVDQTTCDVLATAPADGKKVGFVQALSAELCAEVVETEAEYIDEDPHTHLEGYKSRGNDGGFALVFDGEVTASGTAEYWIKAANNVFPVNGPGMECPEASTGTADEAATTPAPTEAPVTGEVLVKTYHCADVPADTTDYDWFGQCGIAGEVPAYELTALDVESAPQTASAGENGEATFAELTPGTWHLEATDASWCHANSDKVTSEAELVVEAGTTTTVWIFLCDEGKAVE